MSGASTTTPSKAGDDTLVGSSSSGSILAGDAGNVFGGQLFAGADTLSGGNAADSLYGDFYVQSGGTVTINAAFTGDDVLRGGGGNDQLFGQVGDDTLDGGMGDDFIDGGTQTAGVGDIAAFNTLNIAVSVDLALGFAFGQGVDTLVGFESARGSNKADNLAGDNLNNQIEGLDGNDRLFGRNGNDRLVGGKDADVIKAGAGNDIITGGADADNLTGNDGADIFKYDAVGESGVVAATRDVILDFVQGADRIDLRTIDAQAGLAGDQAFTFIGAQDFSTEGQLRAVVSGGHTLILANTSGASGAEMVIELGSALVLTAADFNL
jgi:Ca2+-binding RTX toxin-like protein